MRLFLICLSLVLVRCQGKKPLEKHYSPNADYVLQIEIDRSKENDEHLGFRLLDKKGKDLDYMRTLSGNHMKWAVTWYDENTIILDSHDVGTYGWIVDRREHFVRIDKVSRAMEEKVIGAFKQKYGSHTARHY